MSILREVASAVCCCLTSFFEAERDGCSRDLKRLSDWRAHPTLRQYNLEKHVADGGFSEIWLARHRTTGEGQCLKVVYLRKPGLRAEDAEVLRGEARFLRLLDHPGLLRCRDVFETKYHMIMILEYLSGGEMLSHLHQVEHYSEGEAARLFAQVVAAVGYMHNLNIVHRDIKPENVMFARRVEQCIAQGRPLRVKLIDLGMATVLLPTLKEDEEQGQNGRGQEGEQWPGIKGQGYGKGLRWRHQKQERKATHAEGLLAREQRRQQRHRAPPSGCLGSPGFIAPEVVSGTPHTFAMDVYSLGVLLFVMLTGRQPWPMREVRNLAYARRPITEAPGLQDASFLTLSPTARELLLTMLADDPKGRPSCSAVLRHPFLMHAAAGGPGGAGAALQPPLDDVIKRRIAQLASLRRFRGLAFAMMSSSQKEGQQLSEFLESLAERRKALHRDLVSRAKLRRSVERQRRLLHNEEQREQQRQQQQHQQEELPNGRQAGAKRPPSQQQQVQLAIRSLGEGGSSDMVHGATVTLTEAYDTAAATAVAIAATSRTSIDSTSSQQPLLPSRQLHLSNLSHAHPHPQYPLPHPYSCREADGDDDPDPDDHQYDQYSMHAVRRSTDSVSSASSRQPLMPCAVTLHSHYPSQHLYPYWPQGPPPACPSRLSKTSLDGKASQGVAATAAVTPPQTANHLSEWRTWQSSGSPLHGGGNQEASNPWRHGPHRSYQRHHHLQPHHPQYPSLPSVAEPRKDSSSDASAQTRPQCQPQRMPATAAAAGPIDAGGPPTSRGRGWSSSGYRGQEGRLAALAAAAAAAAPAGRAGGGLPSHESSYRQPQSPLQLQDGGGSTLAAARQLQHCGGAAASSRGRRLGFPRVRGSELELAALDPLSLLRGLPGCRLGRSHSAPESLQAAERSMLWDGEQLAAGARYGVRPGEAARPGRGLGAGECGASGEGVMLQDGTTTWLERLAMGADMRAFSASSWTLDLLANEELLAALTGMDVARRVSSSNYEGTVHDRTLYGVGMSSLSQMTLDAAPSTSVGLAGFAGGGGTLAAPTAAAAAAAAVAAFQRLQSDWSNRGARTSSSALEASVHAASQAAALLAAVGRQSREGWPPSTAAAAGLRPSVKGGTGANMRWPPGSVCSGGSGAVGAPGAALGAPPADTPTRSAVSRVSRISRIGRIGCEQVQSPPGAATVPAACAQSLSAADISKPHVEQQQGVIPEDRHSGPYGVSLFTTMARVPYLGARPVIGAAFGCHDPSSVVREEDQRIRPGALAAAACSRALFSGGANEDAAAVAAVLPPWSVPGDIRSLPRLPDELGDDDCSVQSPYARQDVPMPLLRAARGAGLANGQADDLYGIPSYEVPYASRRLSAASSLVLGIALSAAGPLPSPAAGLPGFEEAAGPGGFVMRRPSLALPHTDDHVAAHRASLEETLHGGDLWLRSILGRSLRPGLSPAGAYRSSGGAAPLTATGGVAGNRGGAGSSGRRYSTGGAGSTVAVAAADVGWGATFAGHAATCLEPPSKPRWRSPFEALATAPLSDAEAGAGGGGSRGASMAGRG